jgi:hypothetical protein
MLPVAAGFARRENPDHTIDLVCKRCFRTVAASKCAADLDSVEQKRGQLFPSELGVHGTMRLPNRKEELARNHYTTEPEN